MLLSISQQHPDRLYRIDKFKVPAPARAEFLEKVQLTHELLRTLPGFIQDLVFEQSDGPGQFNFSPWLCGKIGQRLRRPSRSFSQNTEQSASTLAKHLNGCTLSPMSPLIHR